jgi:hypothetical protein
MAKKSEKTNTELQGPRIPIIKQLFGTCQNRCAFPNCENPIISNAGKVLGEVCHIKAEKPDGPRYDAKQSGEERHSFNNLILLCSTHHTEIDTNPSEYTVGKLIEMKLNHEKSSPFKMQITNAIAKDALDAIFVRMKPYVTIVSHNQSGGQVAQNIKNIVNYPDQDESIGFSQLSLLLKNLREYQIKLKDFYEISKKLDFIKGNGRSDEIKGVEPFFIKAKKDCIDSLKKVHPIYPQKTIAITGVESAYYGLNNAISNVSLKYLLLDKFKDHLEKIDIAIIAIDSHIKGSTQNVEIPRAPSILLGSSLISPKKSPDIGISRFKFSKSEQFLLSIENQGDNDAHSIGCTISPSSDKTNPLFIVEKDTFPLAGYLKKGDEKRDIPLPLRITPRFQRTASNIKTKYPVFCEPFVFDISYKDDTGLAITKHMEYSISDMEIKGLVGFCIRCRKLIPVNYREPYCLECYRTWAVYSNRDYREEFCHDCGIKFMSTINQPFCRNCRE